MFYRGSFYKVACFSSGLSISTTRLLDVTPTRPIVRLLDRYPVQLCRRDYATRSHVTISTTEKKSSRALIYTGAFARIIRAYKTTASLFSLCAVIAMPTLFVYGHDPYVTTTLGKLNTCHIDDRQMLITYIIFSGCVSSNTYIFNSLHDRSLCYAYVFANTAEST